MIKKKINYYYKFFFPSFVALKIPNLPFFGCVKNNYFSRLKIKKKQNCVQHKIYTIDKKTYIN
jgi:hypothetical protein